MLQRKDLFWFRNLLSPESSINFTRSNMNMSFQQTDPKLKEGGIVLQNAYRISEKGHPCTESAASKSTGKEAQSLPAYDRTDYSWKFGGEAAEEVSCARTVKRADSTTAGSGTTVFALHIRQQMEIRLNGEWGLGWSHKSWRAMSRLLRAEGRTGRRKLNRVLKSLSPERRHVLWWSL